MQRYGFLVASLILGAPALLAAEESSYFGPAGRMGYQAAASDQPEPADLAEGSGVEGDLAHGGPADMTGCATCGDYNGALDGACMDGCGLRPNGFWGRAEALAWWIRGSQAPPLLSTSPTGTPTSTAGVLPAATVLYPTGDVNNQPRFGGRFTLGYWCDDCETVGYQGSFFMLATSSHNYGVSSSSSGSPILARPFYNTALPGEDAGLLAYPGLLSGAAAVATQTRLLGADFNFRKAVASNCCDRIDFLFGYRYLRFDDSLVMNSSSTALTSTIVPTGTNFAINDTFGTKNQFNGAQVGMIWQRNMGRWGFDATTKFAIGGLNQHVTVAGATTVSVPNTPAVTETGGFLALGSNSGTYGRTVFSMIPELNANLNYRLNPLWRINVGYTLLFVTQVLRASDQIDRNINPAQFPPPGTGSNTTPPNPGHNLFSSDLWVQGISLGAECRF